MNENINVNTLADEILNDMLEGQDEIKIYQDNIKLTEDIIKQSTGKIAFLKATILKEEQKLEEAKNKRQMLIEEVNRKKLDPFIELKDLSSILSEKSLKKEKIEKPVERQTVKKKLENRIQEIKTELKILYEIKSEDGHLEGAALRMKNDLEKELKDLENIKNKEE